MIDIVDALDLLEQSGRDGPRTCGAAVNRLVESPDSFSGAGDLTLGAHVVLRAAAAAKRDGGTEEPASIRHCEQRRACSISSPAGR